MSVPAKDLKAAATFAAKFASGGHLSKSYLLDDLESSFDALVREAEPLIEQETGFKAAVAARAVVLSRSEWASRNVDSMLQMLSPILDKLERKVASAPAGPMFRMVYRPAVGAQMGMVLGFLSQRVLGQYDVLLGNPEEVWFVGPNIVLTEKRLGFIPRDFRLWVVLHELTHRAQFEGNDWVRPYFRDAVDELLTAMDVDARAIVERLVDAVRSPKGHPIALRFLDPAQQEVFQRLQAFMTVVEGHGNFVMDRVAERIIPTQPRMRRTLRNAGASAGVITKLIGKMLGIELKRAQYVEGQKFFDAILRIGGEDAVKEPFRSSQNLPTLEEIGEPRKWLERISS